MTASKTGSGSARPSALVLESVRFAWRPGEAPVLDLDSLQLAAGDRLLLRGPSGSGKSTLLGLVGGVLRPQQGLIRVLDQDLAHLTGPSRDRFRADHVGFVFQQFNLLPYLGVLDNVLLACRFSPRRRQRLGSGAAGEARRCLAALGMGDSRLQQRPAAELSVGQQQRVAVARALLGEPELVIADEPTSALDLEARDAFLELLFSECRRSGAALLFVSHDPALAHAFPRVLELPAINRAGSPAP